MEIHNKNLTLHYNINLNYNSDGKDLYQIIKEHFLIHIKELKKDKEKQERLIRKSQCDTKKCYI